MDRDLVNRQINDVLKSAGPLPESIRGDLRLAREVIPDLFKAILADETDREEHADLSFTRYLLATQQVAVGVPLASDNDRSISERLFVVPVPHEDGESEVHSYFSESLLAS